MECQALIFFSAVCWCCRLNLRFKNLSVLLGTLAGDTRLLFLKTRERCIRLALQSALWQMAMQRYVAKKKKPKKTPTKTCLYNSDPLQPHFYIVKLGFTGVYIIFLIFGQKHRLWVLVLYFRLLDGLTWNLTFCCLSSIPCAKRIPNFLRKVILAGIYIWLSWLKIWLLT